MNAHSPTPSAIDPDGEPAGDAAAEEMAARHLAMLREMTDMGMDLARAVWRQGMTRAADAAPAEDAAGGVDPGLAYARITRAVRLAMAMEARTLADEAARRAKAAAAQVGGGGADDLEFVRRKISAIIAQAEASGDRETAVLGAVEGLVRAQVGDVGRAFDVLDDLRERLVDMETWDRDLDRPIGEVIEQIARDLGLDPRGPGWAAPEAEDGSPPRFQGPAPACRHRPESTLSAHPRAGGDP